jgi:hypothetical protein
MLLHVEVVHQLLQEVRVAEGLAVADLVRQGDALGAQLVQVLRESRLRWGGVGGGSRRELSPLGKGLDRTLGVLARYDVYI